jgi:hypothetical protein
LRSKKAGGRLAGHPENTTGMSLASVTVDPKADAVAKIANLAGADGERSKLSFVLLIL